jgi:hypothetical protein
VDDVVKAVVAGERRIVVVDVEATCWKEGVFSRKKERIEISAVLFAARSCPIEMAGVSDVRPTAAAPSPLELLSRAHRYHPGERRCRSQLKHCGCS